jgi:predicted anti-sigma-YlaC factor YlaD
MNCEAALDQLESYLAGRLTPPAHTAMERHLEACPSCRGDLAALERVQAELPSLGQSGSEPPDVEQMWAAIQPRLTTRRSRWADRPLALPAWALAAAAAVLVMASIGGTMLVLKSNSLSTAGSQRLGALESDYESASAELIPLLEEARSRLEPATVASLERNLAAIDSALSEVRQALAADPGNLALEQLVLSVWSQKVGLLRRATASGVEL